MTTNNGIPIMAARFSARCSHCGARINVGKAIVKTAAGKWIHARCPKAVPLAPEQEALDTGFPVEMVNERRAS